MTGSRNTGFSGFNSKQISINRGILSYMLTIYTCSLFNFYRNFKKRQKCKTRHRKARAISYSHYGSALTSCRPHVFAYLAEYLIFETREDYTRTALGQLYGSALLLCHRFPKLRGLEQCTWFCFFLLQKLTNLP